jgi:glutamate dehydrogenase/leucine dehydrogenase
VTVSHLEWVQNRTGSRWSEQEVNGHLEKSMVEAFDEVWRYASTQGVSTRLAAHALAMERVAEAVRIRGFHP